METERFVISLESRNARPAKYFVAQEEIFSDNPFTPEVEPAIPFTIATVIYNNGSGTAKNLKMSTSQPEIVNNAKGLLINFKIISVQVCTTRKGERERERERDRERERETEAETETETETERQRDRQRERDRETDRQTDRQRQRQRQRERERGRETERELKRERDRQTDRQIQRGQEQQIPVLLAQLILSSPSLPPDSHFSFHAFIFLQIRSTTSLSHRRCESRSAIWLQSRLLSCGGT